MKPKKADATHSMRRRRKESKTGPELDHGGPKLRGADWVTEENSSFILSALFSGQLCQPTPFAEIAQDCPVVWQRALQVFAGNKAAAREWLETRSAIFNGKCPYIVALQEGGEPKVLDALQRLRGTEALLATDSAKSRPEAQHHVENSGRNRQKRPPL